MAFLRIVLEIVQKEYSWFCLQSGAVLTLHKAAESYLVRLFEDTNLCTIHTRHLTIMPKGYAVGPKDKGGRHQAK